MTKVFQLRISLNDAQPEIWRRFLVEDNISFEKLHNIIQIVMGWENYHMFEFCIGNESIIPDEEGYNLAESSFKKLFNSPKFIEMLESQDIRKKGSTFLDLNKVNKIMQELKENEHKKNFNVNTKINELIKSENQEFGYLYDFGDNWEHNVVVEKIFEKDDSKYPICLAGERNCPPEDCGSVSGYEHLLKVRKNKKHKEYKELIVEWLGEDYDPELFIVDWVNARLHGKKPKPVWMRKRDTPEEQVSDKTEHKRKLGRNEPCHCGSGIKYKKCCLDKDIKKTGEPMIADY